ncbi:hypothetical protein A3F00_03895 [Candidatus Daviesbacteria bacterium RIFCSPHIGHO2_12_FULL_37_11]|uniref:Type 4 fimbrial biogenesis protein PilX N-terminal domain-containing protein n=1 Tax=Candidatus Daviesbacteria bacterium RIFCSPHIGHO2_12_FULL_37_11 TaxID=1797777 RepID=A0A1F5KB93_9BACT|nr:MAG: hypothetical protein A3F00_03895 [Candidatus Daviesbacteria bacterium RIFCSPHIGHO2_12_FULL_37_11]OGE45895.1 MAG: hypothetical protein A3B39_01680 [Candidatus Daviesbacteria bacterium RIFCSPLOWO2_01_FULL_37_10]
MINQSGQVFIFGIVSTGVVLVTTLLTIAGAQLYFQNTNYTLEVEKATALAEAGVDKAISSMNKTGGAYNGESETFFGEGSYSVVVTDKDAGTKIVEATGYIPGKDNPKVRRTVRIEMSKGVGVSFVYGVQVGEGGLELGNTNLITGSVYSNGNITAGNGNTITGDAWVAGGPQPDPDQVTDCMGLSCQDFIVGKNEGGNNQLDVAQSFKPASSGLLNKVSLKLKKIGNPPVINVRILKDSNGSPDKNGVLALGTLFNSLVTGNYGFIDVTFTTSPSLVADTTYWILMDTSQDNNNYWLWQNDLELSYLRGVPKWSPNWSTGNPEWNSISGDLSFKTYMGGAPTSIRGQSNFHVNGNVHANTIDSLTIDKDAYYQTIVNSTVAGSSNPGQADPPPKVFPLSEANIIDWKTQAESLPPVNYSVCTDGMVLGPGKISGSVDLGNGCEFTVKTPLYIAGNLIMNSNNKLTLSSEYGTASGVILVDGQININTHNELLGTGQGNSLLMALSTYDSRVNSIAAIIIGNNGNTGVFYASSGIIEPGSGNSYKELTAWGIRLVNSSSINYETGLSSQLFSSGPTGSFSLIKGTYQVK